MNFYEAIEAMRAGKTVADVGCNQWFTYKDGLFYAQDVGGGKPYYVRFCPPDFEVEYFEVVSTEKWVGCTHDEAMEALLNGRKTQMSVGEGWEDVVLHLHAVVYEDTHDEVFVDVRQKWRIVA